MAKNSLDDFRDHLFTALERLGDEELTDEELDRECRRGDAICNVAKQLTETLKIEADLLKNLGGRSDSNLLRPTAFGLEHDDKGGLRR